MNNHSAIKELIKEFFPYARKRLGFNKPVNIRLRTDHANCQNPLGKTAFYDPDNMSVTLYILNRHPKDVVKSLSHELVHHKQNCNGELEGIGTMEEGYAQTNEHLREMEKEAYLEGCMMFRDFEDSIKGGA